MLKFKIDENLPIEIKSSLESSKYLAETINDEGLAGSSDDIISQKCQFEERTIVTLDKDFSDINKYPPDKYFGIIVLRPRSQDRNHVIALFERAIKKFKTEDLIGKLWIVEENRIRVWKD